MADPIWNDNPELKAEAETQQAKYRANGHAKPNGHAKDANNGHFSGL